MGTFKRPFNSRSGVVLYVLLSVLLVISIFSFSMHQMAIQKVRQARHLHDSYGGTILARSAIAYAIAKIQEGIENPTSPLFKLFLQQDLKPGTPISIDQQGLTLIAEGYREGKVQVSAIIEKVSPLDPMKLTKTSTGFDPAERRFELLISTYASCGKIETILKEKRELRIVHLMPEILGKFTLFVKNAEPDPLAYNRFAGTIDGFPDTGLSADRNCLPVILKNGGELDEGTSGGTDPDVWQRRGFIFFGGNPVKLNLTSGNYEAYGELFHFYNLDETPNIPGYFDPFPPAFFAVPPDFSNRHSQSLNAGEDFAADFAYTLKHVISGFFTIQDDGTGMNTDNRLSLSFPGTQKTPDPRMYSSSLHLYGTRSNPSPTLILGNVMRRYADYAAIVLEATGDELRDAIINYVRETGQPLSALPLVPQSILAAPNGSLAEGTSIALDLGLVNYSNMFSSDGVYREKMCSIKEEPYLCSHDFMFYREEGNCFPGKSAFGVDSAEIQKSFSLEFHPSLGFHEPFYDHGDLSKMTGDFLTSKSIYRLPDLNTFLEKFYNPKTNALSLGTNAIITGEAGRTYRLPAAMKIDKGGILSLENGDLQISGIRQGGDPDELLTIAVLKGNIELNLSQENKIQARLIALNGSLRNLTPFAPIDLRGGLVLNSYSPEAFPRGGRVDFDSRSDPGNPEWANYYRGFSSDLILWAERN